MSEYIYKIDGYKSNVVEELARQRHIAHEPRQFDANIGLLPDIYKAVDIIAEAIEGCKKILIFGDYDCDGITATTILYKYLSYCTPFVKYYIPDRLNEGYGLSIEAIKDKDIDLLITVDNGITAFEPVKYLKEKGVQVVITDHHECMETLPEADAIVDCKRSDSKHPFKGFCGAEVACLVAMALDSKYEYGYDNFEELLDLAAVATIADVMPLTEENRDLVSERLLNLAYSESKGLRTAIKKIYKEKTELSSEDIAFDIAPLINCASRLGQTNLAIGLLNAEDDALVEDLTEKLISLNNKRKRVSESITKSAVDHVLSGSDILCSGPIVAESTAWHKGIIGISAAKIVDMFNVPVFIGKEEEGIVHGSARAYSDFNVVDALSSFSNHLLTYGGHEGAGGFSFESSHLDQIKAALDNYYYTHTPILKDRTVVDALLPLSFCSYDGVQALEDLGPFGEGNPKPVFVSRNVTVVQSVPIGKDLCTLKLVVSDGDSMLNCIGFHMGYFADLVHTNDVIDIVYTLGFNTFNGRSTIQAKILDVKTDAVKRKNEEIYNN
ncbi:single-stranded-DNA-specific exonuclease RecJ, partial [Ruminococcus sp.]|uniref:single-stranded-DNA-specific exonuclease RecJ n=1 Tax=Ruminococcus sp. TaxID=41978 RepID=UPI002590EA34